MILFLSSQSSIKHSVNGRNSGMQGPRLGDVIWCRIHEKQNCAAGYFLHNVLVSFGLSSRIDQFKTCGFLVVSFLQILGSFHLIWMSDLGDPFNCTRRKAFFATELAFCLAFSDTMLQERYHCRNEMLLWSTT